MTEPTDHERLFEMSSQLRRGPFGRQHILLDFIDLAQKISLAARGQAAVECPVCARRLEQTRNRVYKAREGKPRRRSKKR